MKNIRKTFLTIILSLVLVAGLGNLAKGQGCCPVGGCGISVTVCNHMNCSLPISVTTSCCGSYGVIWVAPGTCYSFNQCLQWDGCAGTCITGLLCSPVAGGTIMPTGPGQPLYYSFPTFSDPSCCAGVGAHVTYDLASNTFTISCLP